MADALASALIGTIVTNLNNEALKQYGLLTGLNTELEKLRGSFTLIQGVLNDAEAKQWSTDGEAVKTWLRLLKDAAYDADDVLDEFDIKSERRQRRRVRSCFSLHHNPIAFRVEMARKLKNVREKLDATYEKRPPSLRVGPITSPHSELEWRLTTSLVDDSKICGRDHQKAKLVNDLISSSEALSIHALCGMGGLGKTTLAQLVYNAENIESHFDVRMWVCVSDDTDIKRLTEAAIESIENDTDSKEHELDSLQRRLREKLGGKRFLLVLDDVWDDFLEKWDRFKNAVISGGRGSVVLITTRILQVAAKMSTVPIHHVGRLSDEDSWSLFAIHAFKMGNSEEQERFKKFREGIVDKCGGVPLVLKVFGNLMQLKKEENEWSDVMESELWDLPDEGKRIVATLTLSYTHLPINLRQCFSYCSIFPKNHVMGKNLLIQLWMANGFLSSGGRKGLHERGQDIFKELVARSFFQNVATDYLGNTICKMHDLLHDVATSVMKHELHLIRPSASLEGPRNLRHLAHIGEVEEFVTLVKGNPKTLSLRSIFLVTEDENNRSVKFLSTQKYLRILCSEKLPMPLSKHLRYIDVSESSISRLPNSICLLYKLQTLNLRDCKYLKHLPKGMKEMKSLMYLELKGCDRLKGMPPGMGKLKGMRKFSKFIVGKQDGCKIGELKELNGLEGELTITYLCNVKSVAEAESANLLKKKMLTFLVLAGGEYKVPRSFNMEVLSALQPHQNLRKLVIDGYESLKLPNWMMDLHLHLPHLVQIKLWEFTRYEQLRIPLGRLDSLTLLELCGMSCLMHIGAEVYGDGERAAFPSLMKLVLYGMWSLKEWPEVTTTSSSNSSSSSRAAFPFPCLRELYFEKCPLLTKFPIIPSLQDLSIWVSTVTTSELTVLVQANFISLKSLSLDSCDELESLPELDPRHNVCYLENLTILSCNILKSLPSTGLWCSSTLRILKIKKCDEFITLSEDGLRHLTALERLYFHYCPKMTSLPESIQHLTALQLLCIECCEGLSCLPVGMRSLTTLAALHIIDCPNLERRCEREKGEDWPMIAHIPEIIINDEEVQLQDADHRWID